MKLRNENNMETKNHEYYVLLEVAKLLKEAGFDWEIDSLYQMYPEEPVKFEVDSKLKYNWNIHSNVISAPTLEVAQRWLRETKNISVEISFENPGKWSCCVILDTNKGVSFENFWREEFDYDTYEEAQEAGIKKALEIILEKGE